MSQQLTEISVIIVEDHSIFIEGLCSILRNVEGVKITNTFTDAEPALEFLRLQRADVVFLDISLSGMSGIEACKAIKVIDNSIKIIALTNHTEKSVIMDMLQNGADAYLLKNTSRKDLITAIFQVLNNQFLMNSELQKILFSAEIKPKDIPRLTQREQEVLKLVSEGATTGTIARQLFISPQTVETHRHNLMQKFQVNNSALLIKKASEYGMV
nr:response regulator transcription factor [Pedobacter panaciterrae]